MSLLQKTYQITVLAKYFLLFDVGRLIIRDFTLNCLVCVLLELTRLVILQLIISRHNLNSTIRAISWLFERFGKVNHGYVLPYNCDYL